MPCTDKDAEGAEYESGDEAGDDQLQALQHLAQVQQSARKAQRLDDEDFDADHDSDAAPMSDDERLDSDANVSDDQAPSGSDDESLAAKAKKTTKKFQRHGNRPDSKQRSGKLNTPSRGLNKPSRSAAATSIGPLTRPDMTGAAGGMMFVPTGATGTASAAGNGAAWPGEGHQLLGKRRTTEGLSMPGSEAKRRLSEGDDDSPGAGNDSFKRAMLEKLLAKRNMASGSGSGGSSTGGSARLGMTKLARGVSGIERRASGGAGGSSLQRAVSDADVRQKAAGQLAVGLKKAVEELQEKHRKEQQGRQQVGDGQPAGEEQQPEGVQQQDVTMTEAEAGSNPEQQQEQPVADSDHPMANQAADSAVAGTAAIDPMQTEAAAALDFVQPAETSQPDEPPQQQQQQQQQESGRNAQQQQQQQDQPMAAADADLQLPDPQELASTIEQQLYELCGK